MISPFQLDVLERMKRGQTLSNCYEGETAPYRPPNGMYSGYMHSNSHTQCVPYRTIAALLKAGLIEETHRTETQGRQGDNRWQSATIYYKLTDKALAGPLADQPTRNRTEV